MFASKVDRVGRKMRNSFNDNMTTGNVKVKSKLVSAGVKSQHALSPQYENPNGEMMDDDEYYDEDDDGTTPGPGSYFNPQSSTTFKVKQVPERLQFFGSTVERFNRNTRQLDVVPGPGAYTVTTTSALRA